MDDVIQTIGGGTSKRQLGILKDLEKACSEKTGVVTVFLNDRHMVKISTPAKFIKSFDYDKINGRIDNEVLIEVNTDSVIQRVRLQWTRIVEWTLDIRRWG